MEHADLRDLSVPELTAQLGEQVTQLARAELTLARAELFASARQAVLGGEFLAAAAIMGPSGPCSMSTAPVAMSAGITASSIRYRPSAGKRLAGSDPITGKKYTCPAAR